MVIWLVIKLHIKLQKSWIPHHRIIQKLPNEVENIGLDREMPREGISLQKKDRRLSKI